ncbi:MAG: class II fructose-bisphosphate aldolase [Candidatus Pacebacteria bacterium]|nr:class II fructose-bisphosphate aldolase [Candidatus Paceibacterota bacterium]
MISLKECILEARKNAVAVGHFNVSTIDGIWAVADAAQELKVPVIIGLSEGERDYVGVREAVAIVRAIREEREQPIYINADHTYSYEKIVEAVDAGFDAVIFDGAKLPFDENVAATKKCLEYAKTKNPGVVFEAELGYIGQSSQVLAAVPVGVQLTSPDEAKRFADLTGIDMLAPAVGNFHGMLLGDPSLTFAAKKISPERIGEISVATGLPLVLHGGSGQGDDAVKAAIKAGVNIVHVNTELRMAYRAGLMKSLTDNPDEVAPYKYMKPAKLAMQAVVSEKLRVFNM